MTLSTAPLAAETRATRQATANLAQNRTSGLIADALDLEWVYGRDGALTARDADDRWFGGCSLPRRAAMTQLRKLDCTGSVACFLAPAHASAIRVALGRLQAEQAIIAIVPDEHDYQFMLHCEDFSRDREAHRVHFVVGERWTAQLVELFDRIPGLAIPSQFIRVTPDGLDAMIADAQRIFSEVTARRAEQMHTLRTRPRAARSTRRLCVAARSQRRLWNDWGAILADAICDDDCVRIDPDDPNQSSPLAVARAASECDAIVTVDVSRADVPGIVSDEIPWVTWIAGGKIPVHANCGPRDRLLLLDERDLPIAREVGWRDSAVRIAKPPMGVALSIDPPETSKEAPFIAIVADTLRLEPPANIDDFSSHRLLWDLVSDELLCNPFSIGDDIDAYLTSRMRKLDVSEQTLSRPTFIASLIVPAYQHGLLRTLIDAKIPVRAFGRNWNTIDDRSLISRALAPSAALLHVFPDQRRLHAVDFSPRPVIRPGRTAQQLVQRCREALASPQPVATSSANIICAAIIRELIAAN